jgi:hypothetical protein
MLKKPTSVKRDTLKSKFTAIYCHVSPTSLLGMPAGNCQRALVDESGVIITQMGGTQYIINGRSAWDALCDTTL